MALSLSTRTSSLHSTERISFCPCYGISFFKHGNFLFRLWQVFFLLSRRDITQVTCEEMKKEKYLFILLWQHLFPSLLISFWSIFLNKKLNYLATADTKEKERSEVVEFSSRLCRFISFLVRGLFWVVSRNIWEEDKVEPRSIKCNAVERKRSKRENGGKVHKKISPLCFGICKAPFLSLPWWCVTSLCTDSIYRISSWRENERLIARGGRHAHMTFI